MSIQDFFALDWVNDCRSRVEILLLERQHLSKDKRRTELQGRDLPDVAFPGGKKVDTDDNSLFTGMLFLLRTMLRLVHRSQS